MWSMTAASSVPEPKMFDKGLIFVKDTDILLSGDKRTIVVNNALEDYANLVELLKSMVGAIRQKIQVHKNSKVYSVYSLFDIHWEEINRLEKMVEELEVESGSFQKLLFEEAQVKRNPRIVNTRTKRGLLNVLGYGLKYLFGTADARDVRRVDQVCDELHAFKNKVMHAAEHQLTYIHTLDEMTRQNIMDTVELARALRDSVRNISLQLNGVESALLDTQAAIEKQARYSAAIREIEIAILELRLSMTQLQESLDVTSIGKLSSVLINPNNLSNILQQELGEGM